MDDIIQELKNRGVVNIGITLNPENPPTHEQAISGVKQLLRHYLDGDYSVVDGIGDSHEFENISSIE